MNVSAFIPSAIDHEQKKCRTYHNRPALCHLDSISLNPFIHLCTSFISRFVSNEIPCLFPPHRFSNNTIPAVNVTNCIHHDQFPSAHTGQRKREGRKYAYFGKRRQPANFLPIHIQNMRRTPGRIRTNRQTGKGEMIRPLFQMFR